LRHLNQSFSNLLSSNNFFYYSIDRNRNLNRHNDLPLNLDYIRDLNRLSYDFLHFNLSWNFLHQGDWYLSDNLFGYDLLLHLWHKYCFLYHSVNWSFDLHIHILYHFNFFDDLFYHWNMNNLFNLSNHLSDHFSLHYLFNYLRNFNHFFHYSWDYYNLFDDFLNLNNFRNFNHLFDHFLYNHSNLFDSIDYGWNFNDFFFNLFYYLWHFHVHIHKLLYLNYHWLSHNKRLFDEYLFNVNRLYSRNYGFFNN